MTTKTFYRMFRVCHWLVPVLIVLATFTALLPTLQNGFVNWDDQQNLLDNLHYRGLGWPQLKWMWTTFHMSLYRPLTWMTYGADYLLWGMNPFGYHLTSLLLHILNAVILYFLALHLLHVAMPDACERENVGLAMSAGVAALLFAVHPLRAEPVAWVSARADVLSGMFFLLSILMYLTACGEAHSRPGRWRWLLGAVALFALSLLSKQSSVSLPIILIVLDVYPLRRLGGRGRWFAPMTRQVWLEKVPFFAVGLAAMPIPLFSKAPPGATVALEHYKPIHGMALALFGSAFHLWKTFVPRALSPLYERPPQLNPWDWPFLLSGSAVLVISVILVVGRRHWPAGLVGWVCYLIILMPTVGIIPFGPQIAADRYTYLSCLGWAILAGGGLLFGWQAWARGRIGRVISLLIGGLALSTITGLGVLTWHQVQIWHDSKKLWSYTLSIDPHSTFAHNNLGSILKREGRLTEAVDHFQRAVRIDPTYATAHANLGQALLEQGKLNQAIEHYQQSLRLEPTLADAHYNLGYALASQGKVGEAIDHFQQAVRIDPTHARARANLGAALLRQGHVNQAIKHLEQAAQTNPNSAEIHYNLGLALVAQGGLREAIDHYEQALKLKPNLGLAHFHLANVLLQQGKANEALEHYYKALEVRPAYPEAHNNVGVILMRQGKLPGAIDQFKRALQINPAFSEALSNLDAALSLRSK